MRLIIILSLIAFTGGCSHWTEGREVICKVTCENCEKVTHICNGTTDEKISELNK